MKIKREQWNALTREAHIDERKGGDDGDAQTTPFTLKQTVIDTMIATRVGTGQHKSSFPVLGQRTWQVWLLSCEQRR